MLQHGAGSTYWEPSLALSVTDRSKYTQPGEETQMSRYLHFISQIKCVTLSLRDEFW